jgi:hypothetical protein
MSAAKAGMLGAYVECLQNAIEAQLAEKGHLWCERCGRTPGEHEPLDPHHPEGRRGHRMLIVKLVCRKCHDEIHANAKQARKDGWIIDSTQKQP